MVRNVLLLTKNLIRLTCQIFRRKATFYYNLFIITFKTQPNIKCQKKVTYNFKGSKIPFSDHWFGAMVIKHDFPVRIQIGKLGSEITRHNKLPYINITEMYHCYL